MLAVMFDSYIFKPVLLKQLISFHCLFTLFLFWVVSFVIHHLLLGTIFLRYQGNVLLTHHVRAVHRNLLWAGVVCLQHRRRVADVGVVDGVWAANHTVTSQNIYTPFQIVLWARSLQYAFQVPFSCILFLKTPFSAQLHISRGKHQSRGSLKCTIYNSKQA